MPTNLADQNWTVPIGSDLADNPLAFTDFAADVMATVVLRYPNTATRDSFDAGRVAGDISFTTGNTWYERWTGSKWIPCTPIQVVKSADQIVNNSTTSVNDTSLVVPLPAANTSYAVEGVIYYISSTTADIKFTFTGPAGFAGALGGVGIANTAAGNAGDGNFGTVGLPGGFVDYGGAGLATLLTASLRATVATGATIGNLQLQWAQNTLDATDTTVFSRSRLSVQAIS